MIVKNLKISEIRASSFDFKTQKLAVDIYFENETSIKKYISLDEDLVKVINNIMQIIKSSKRPEPEDTNDVLGGIVVVNIYDEDKIKESLVKFLVKLESKLSFFRQTTGHREYMDIFYELRSMEEVIFKR